MSVTEKDQLTCAHMRDWDIVVSAEAIPSERYAAEEFQRWFGQATGLNLPIRTPAEGRACRVCIGSTSLSEGDSSGDTSAMGEEGFRIRIEKDRVAIVGGGPRGTLYGVYQFLEDLFAVRFLTCDHTHVPDGSTARIPIGTYAYIPPFSFRWSYYRENSEHPEFAARLRVNTVTEEEWLGGKIRQNLINHTFHMLVPFEKYGKDHPEYYALVKGKRDTNTHGGGPQLCVANPEVIEIAAAAAIKHLDEHPGLGNISVRQADTDAYCRCEACEAINQREGTAMGAQLGGDHLEVAHPEGGRAARGRGGGEAAPRHGPNARDDLAHAERLGDEIIGAELKTHDLVDLLGFGADENDRQGGRLPADLTADVVAAQFGHHDIEADEIGRFAAEDFERLVARARGLSLVAFALQDLD